MTTYRVDELEGQRLADAVALAEGFVSLHNWWRTPDGFEIDKAEWRPDENAGQGAPIIFSENIALLPPGFPDLFEKGWTACVDPGVDGDGDFAYGYDSNHKPLLSTGPTPLVAGLRCWLLLKAGETVELP